MRKLLATIFCIAILVGLTLIIPSISPSYSANNKKWDGGSSFYQIINDSNPKVQRVLHSLDRKSVV